MSSMLCSQGVAFATAMAAVSGTVVLLAFRLQRSSLATQFHLEEISKTSPQILRSCISPERKRKKKNKRVHFAEDVMDPSGDGEEYRRRRGTSIAGNSTHSVSQTEAQNNKKGDGCVGETKGMPANRLALYNGILRDRVVHRVSYSY